MQFKTGQHSQLWRPRVDDTATHWSQNLFGEKNNNNRKHIHYWKLKINEDKRQLGTNQYNFMFVVNVGQCFSVFRPAEKALVALTAYQWTVQLNCHHCWVIIIFLFNVYTKTLYNNSNKSKRPTFVLERERDRQREVFLTWVVYYSWLKKVIFYFPYIFSIPKHTPMIRYFSEPTVGNHPFNSQSLAV